MEPPGRVQVRTPSVVELSDNRTVRIHIRLHAVPLECNTAPMTSWRAEQFDLLPQSVQHRWSNLDEWDQGCFSSLVGVKVEELRRDYARVSMAWHSELNQPNGLMHPGAIATLVDTAVVPAIGTAYDERRRYSTIELSVRYLSAVRQEDLVAEAWVTRRGHRIVFCEAEVRTSTAVKVASANCIYVVGSLDHEG